MKIPKFLFSILFMVTCITSYCTNSVHSSVNAVIGDLSFIHKFGFKPTEKTDDVLRIKTHLEFVEKLLRNKRISHLTAAQKKSRAHLLDLLHDYWNAGIFPANYDYEGQRISCFIDKESRICAVGFLIEQTAGREIAEKINDGFQYSNITDMNDPLVEDWIASSGLSLLECAMIQPEYGYINPNPPVYSWTAPVVYVRDTKQELKLQTEIDSQAVVIGQLTATADSLNRELEIYVNKTDSLNTLSIKNANEINQLKSNSKTQVAVIWTLATAVGALLIFGLIKWFKTLR